MGQIEPLPEPGNHTLVRSNGSGLLLKRENQGTPTRHRNEAPVLPKVKASGIHLLCCLLPLLSPSEGQGRKRTSPLDFQNLLTGSQLAGAHEKAVGAQYLFIWGSVLEVTLPNGTGRKDGRTFSSDHYATSTPSLSSGLQPGRVGKRSSRLRSPTAIPDQGFSICSWACLHHFSLRMRPHSHYWLAVKQSVKCQS